MVRRSASIAFLVSGLGAVAAYLAVDDPRVGTGLYELIAWGGCAALVTGLLVHRPRPVLPWALLAASQVAWASGDAIWDFLDARGEVPFPGAPDGLYLLGYAVLGTALVAMARAQLRPPDLGDVVDATIVAVAAGVLVWPWIFEPHLEEGFTAAVAVTVAYALFDIVFLALVVRLFLQTGSRSVAHWLVAASIGLVLLSDLAYASPVLAGTYDIGTWRELGWLAGYVVIGAAGLHPSLASSAARTPRETSVSVWRLAAVALALFALPTAVLVDAVYDHLDGDDAVVFVGVAFVVALLIVLRVGRLVVQAEGLRRDAAASERKFRAVFDSAGVGISIGTDGRMTETNEAYQRMLGYSGEELAGMHFLDVTHPEDRDLTVRAEDLPRGARQVLEKRYLRRDGSTFWANVTVSYAADGDFGIGVVEDVTERRQLEEELRQAQKMEAVGQLAGGVAHDFNNILMAISGYAELAQGRLPDGDPARRDVAEISRSAARAAELTQRLLAFGRRQVLRAEVVDLNDAVARAGSLLDRLLGSDVELVADLAPGLRPVSADPAQLEQIVVNLAVNARDAMPAGGRLTVATAAVELSLEHAFALELPPGPYVVLEVRDTGEGMDEATRAHAFEPFFTTKPPGQGSGLGLSMVYGAVRQSGGAAEIESIPGAGTLVRILLPEAGPGEHRASEPPAGPVAGESPAAGARILLVEDEPAVAAVVREVLEDAGYAVAHAADGRQGLALAEASGPFDLLVTDLVMPQLNGPQLAEQVLALHPGTIVLYISGYPGEEVVARGLLEPETPYLEKPFALAPFLEHVRRLLAARPAPV